MKKHETSESNAEIISRLKEQLRQERETNDALRVALEKLLWALRAKNDGPPLSIQIPPNKTH